MRRRGFTLVELLVVIGILGILAGIALPVLARARASGRTAVCLSNIRQIGQANALYLQDYDERFPDFRSDPFSAGNSGDSTYVHDHFCCCLFLTPGQTCFFTATRPYIGSSLIGFCPADVDRTRGGRDTTSYEYKFWLSEGRSMAHIPSPANLALLWEQWAYHTEDGHLSEYDRRSGMNIAAADGHARWRRLSQTTSAMYGAGPDLHMLFRESSPSDPLRGQDFAP